jgi:N6-adenosine-specific RNA methylase IME4
MKFDVFYADPPWVFRPWAEGGGTGRLPQDKYPTLNRKALIEMGELIKPLRKPNSVLFLWGVWRDLPLVLDVMEAWGFTYKTNAFVWVKRKNNKYQWGTGYYTRANTEFVLLGTRGKMVRQSKAVHEIIEQERTGHSQKPWDVYDKMEQLYPQEMYPDRLELFANSRTADRANEWGFLPIGLEVTGNDIRDDLRSLQDGDDKAR